jgi:G3E family GTPase
LILETSGVALPGEIVLNFWRPPVSDVVSDTAVAVVVDAVRLDDLADDETFLDQIQAADLVILSKIDLVDVAARERAHERLASMTNGQPVIGASYGRVPLEALFPPDPAPRRPGRPHQGDHHHDRFESHRLQRGGIQDGDAVIDELRALGAIRVKGFVRTPEGVKVLQGVGARIELSDPAVPPPEDLIGTIVVIRAVGDGGHGTRD